MARCRWHLEHADGRRWTEGELTAIVRGGPGDNDGWDYLDHDYGDAEVVWDG